MSEWEDVESEGSVWPAVLAAAVVLAVLASIGIYVVRISKTAQAAAEQQSDGGAQRRQAQPQDTQEGAGRGAAATRMQQRLRRRRDMAAAAAAEASEDQQESGNAEGDDEGAGLGNRRQPNRAQQATADGCGITKQQAYDDKRRARDDAREAEEEALAAEIARLDAARLAEQDAEAAKWVGQIKLEGMGTGEEESSNAEAKLADLLTFIKKHKIVALDDLAAQFSMRTQDVINRIGELEGDGRLTGVMDDRGKFIYISPSEMQAVAAFVHQRGRVAIAELAARSNEFIDLEVKAESAKDIAVQDLFEDEPSPESRVPNQ